MISIFPTSSREGARSTKVAHQIAALLTAKGEAVQIFDWANVPTEAFAPPIFYNYKTQSEGLLALQQQFFIEPNKHIYVLPEYNGSFPGEIKLLIDALSTKDRDLTFKGKKVALIGVAAGRSGNVRGLDDFTGVLNYLGSIVWPVKLPISMVNKLMDEAQNEIVDVPTLMELEKLLTAFAEF